MSTEIVENLDKVTVKEGRIGLLLQELGVPAAEFCDPKLPRTVFSYSQYNAYSLCGKAYEYKYVVGVKTPEYVATTKGHVLHAGFNYALRAKIEGYTLTLEDLQARVEKAFNEKRAQIEDWTDTSEFALLQTIRNTTAYFYENVVPQLNPKFSEKGFAKKVGDVPMVGWIDLVDRVNQVSPEAGADFETDVVVDFKVAKSRWSEADVDSSPQLTLYTLVAGTPLARIDQLVQLKKGPTYVRAETKRSGQSHDILVEHLQEVTQDIKRGIFQKAPTDSWQCSKKFCSYWDKCRGRKR